MSMRSFLRTGLPAFATLLIAAAWPASAQFSISSFTIDGGGVTSATGGSFSLGATIGQPDAGQSSGGGFVLNGGFWHGGGVVSSVGDDGPIDGGSDPSSPVPVAFRLYPATPNPVLDRMVLAFDLPESNPVRAELYDATGRLVRTLANEVMPAGRYQRVWDGRSEIGQRVPSGIYFVRLDAGAHHARLKIVVVS
ncbi:MAG: T9SS type A sorting domain-containing protein [Candidatus Eisenbacteria bacterium]|uniref:T9SS type A sorting domain-containing protein n=1 Tax=Eiseniibacteriota bacterium TaxID=2212470 RepID=A0A956M4H7_UNCEI|nr:T9SS type A sorting domain-containing protein [Candidatus Eisenbacteria bacterium]